MRAHNDRMNVFGNTNTKLDNDSVEENLFSVDWLHHGYYPINLKNVSLDNDTNQISQCILGINNTLHAI